MEQESHSIQNNPTKDSNEGDILQELPIKEVYGQLISILSNRRRDAEGKLVIGITEDEIKRVLNHTTLEETQELMQEFGVFLLTIGLSLVKFPFQSQNWYAIKSVYAAPIDLKEDELAILGTCIMLIEKNENKNTEMRAIVDYLTIRDYFNEYKIKNKLKFLMTNGYITKGKLGKLRYGPKLLIEINEEARKLIARQTTELMF